MAERLPDIEAGGAEAVLADPDRVATLVPAFDHVTVACILLGSAVGSEEQLAALHGTRLEMLLTKLVDTTARGVVYEVRGSVPGAVLAAGAERVRKFARRSLAGYAIYPFVGVIEPGITWTLSAREVERVLELPLRELRDGYKRLRLIRRGIPILTESYSVDENLIWGATARILSDLFDRIEPLL